MRASLALSLAAIILQLNGSTAHAAAAVVEDEEKVAFSDWNYAVPSNGTLFQSIAYQVKRTGFHSADIHFKNFATHDISFKFWLPGFQRPDQSAAVRVPVSAPNDREWIVPVEVNVGPAGLRFAPLKMTYISFDNTARKLSAEEPKNTVPQPFPTDEAWMSIVADPTLIAFSAESVACRVIHDAGGDRVHFKNMARENVFFDFAVLGYQTLFESKNVRVRMNIGEDVTIPVKLNHVDAAVSIARVRAYNIHINGDAGAFLDESFAEEGWFAVTALNSPNINPNQIMYRFENAKSGPMKIHFKNDSRLPVSFNYSIGASAASDRVNIDAEGETVVVAPQFKTSGPTALTRIRVAEVRYGAAPVPGAASK